MAAHPQTAVEDSSGPSVWNFLASLNHIGNEVPRLGWRTGLQPYFRPRDHVTQYFCSGQTGREAELALLDVWSIGQERYSYNQLAGAMCLKPAYGLHTYTILGTAVWDLPGLTGDVPQPLWKRHRSVFWNLLKSDRTVRNEKEKERASWTEQPCCSGK